MGSKRHTMKVSHQMLFFASFLVFFESAKALETECDVCHVNYYHKHVSTPTFMPSDVNVCREYQYEACCSLDTVRKVPTQMISDLYGDEYNHGLCVDIVDEDFTAMSTGCQAYFDAGNCFYESIKTSANGESIRIVTK